MVPSRSKPIGSDEDTGWLQIDLAHQGNSGTLPEFYTPKEVGWLMSDLLNPRPLTTIHDPTCGSGGLLLKPRLRFLQRYPELKGQAPRLYGQELNPTTFAMAKMNMFLHDFTDAVIAIGDTLQTPRFMADGAGLQRFDYVIANPMLRWAIERRTATWPTSWPNCGRRGLSASGPTRR